MSNNVLYPLLIAGACAIVVYVVHRLTRPEPSRADITLPDGAQGQTPAQTPGSTIEATSELARWHLVHETAVLNYFEHYDELLAATDDPQNPQDAEVSSAFESASAAHPAPEMRAELAATRTAADAMLLAKDRGDEAALERHRSVYCAYRASWLERLWQFAGDHSRIARLRRGGLRA